MSDGRLDAERLRLEETKIGAKSWRKWGPYLSERQWGTVREDYSDNGAAWDYFSHDQSARALIAGVRTALPASPMTSSACASASGFGTARIRSSRSVYSASPTARGNHGEDVKELYFYLDSTPTHSYMRYLYKYPQAAYPYDQLVRENGKRSRTEPEYELLDTGHLRRRSLLRRVRRVRQENSS